MSQAALRRRLLAEFLGSAFLAAVVIGSGIAAQRDAAGIIVPHHQQDPAEQTS